MKYVFIFMIFFFLTGCSSPSEDELFQPSTEESELFISAATSLAGVLDGVVDAFKEEQPYIEITVNYGGSGVLSQQIHQGAPVDIFLSADQMRMNLLEEQDLIRSETKTDFAENRLVLVGEKDNKIKIQSLEELPSLDTSSIAIGNPDSVPAGNYAREALISSNAWGELTDQFIFAKDVRQALAYVESGNADIGFVYYTDALKSDSTEILLEIDASLHTPISYPAAVMANSTSSIEAGEFIDFLESDTAKEILETHGFTD